MKKIIFYFLAGAIYFLGSVTLEASASDEREALLQQHPSQPPAPAAEPTRVDVDFSLLGEGEEGLRQYFTSHRRSLDLREVRKRLMRHVNNQVGFTGAANAFLSIPAHLCPSLYRDYSQYDRVMRREETLLTGLAAYIWDHSPPDFAAITRFLIKKKRRYKRLAENGVLEFAIVRNVTPREGEDKKRFYARLRAEGRHRGSFDALYRALSEGLWEDLRRDAYLRSLREAEACSASSAASADSCASAVEDVATAVGALSAHLAAEPSSIVATEAPPRATRERTAERTTVAERATATSRGGEGLHRRRVAHISVAHEGEAICIPGAHERIHECIPVAVNDEDGIPGEEL